MREEKIKGGRILLVPYPLVNPAKSAVNVMKSEESADPLFKATRSRASTRELAPLPNARPAVQIHDDFPELTQ